MKHEVIVPNVGESISEVFIGTWLKRTGDLVKKDEVLVDLETQKTSFELHAEFSGRVEVLRPEPETKVRPGDVIAIIDDSVKVGEERVPEGLAPAPEATSTTRPSPADLSAARPMTPPGEPVLSPSARKLSFERQIDPFSVRGTGKGGRILKEDVLSYRPPPEPRVPEKPTQPLFEYKVDPSRGETIEPASRIRKTIAENLVRAQHTAAILTTFNEADMGAVMEFRAKHKEEFKARHGVSLGIVGFFAKAVVRAIEAFPVVNATFTGEEIIRRGFVDLGVAVSTEAGLVVPVIRDVEKMSLAQFEIKLGEVSEKARAKKLSIQEMTGGTFTISNGGVFGSLLSTPILNMPQSGILGLHKIQDRPVVVEKQIVIRPMMYLALSYDHRIIDGREAVSFLVKVKEGIEDLSLILGPSDW